MRNLEKYIELLEDEIYQTVVHEIADGELTLETEQALHVLFENHKHAERFLEDMKAEYAASVTARPSSATAMHSAVHVT